MFAEVAGYGRYGIGAVLETAKREKKDINAFTRRDAGCGSMGDVEPELRTELGKLTAQLSTAREGLVNVEASIASACGTLADEGAKFRTLETQGASDEILFLHQFNMSRLGDDVQKLEIKKWRLEHTIEDTGDATDVVSRLLECTQMPVSDIEREISYMHREINRKKYEADNTYYDCSQPQRKQHPTDSSFEKKKLAILTRLLEEKRRMPEVPGLNEFFDGTWDRNCAQYKRAIGYIERDLSSIAPSDREQKLKLLDYRKLRREQLARALNSEHTACMSLIDRLRAMPAAPNVGTALSRLGLMETAIQREMNLVAVDLEIAAVERQIEDGRAFMLAAFNNNQNISAMQRQITAQETWLEQKLEQKKQIEKS